MTERIIEIGPSDTLLNMVKRTLDLKYTTSRCSSFDAEASLSYKKDSKTIYFEEDPVEEAVVLTTDVPVEIADAPVVSPLPNTVAASLPLDVGAVKVTDCPVTAAEIIKVLVSYSLKKPVNYVTLSSSIKSLAGGPSFPLIFVVLTLGFLGRSTLQNEVIGDLSNEFR